MSYLQFKTAIQRYLEQHPGGVTWQELRAALRLPYEQPCPEWTRRLEAEMGLIRHKSTGRALHWTLQPTPEASHV